MSTKNYTDPISGLNAALVAMKVDASLLNTIMDMRNEWATFGKMNSHLYRNQLNKLFDSASLSAQARFMVYFFFSVIKNQERVVKAMKDLPDNLKTEAWYNPVMRFIETSITQYVTTSKRTNKFPAVNIPTTNPAVDILVYCLITNPADRSIDELAMRTTFSQMALNAEMQAVAKQGYAHYWNSIVIGTKNNDKTDAPKMREEFYNTSAADKYQFVDVSLKPISIPVGGYTREFVLNYLRTTAVGRYTTKAEADRMKKEQEDKERAEYEKLVEEEKKDSDSEKKADTKIPSPKSGTSTTKTK